jgi:hypothetical protein
MLVTIARFSYPHEAHVARGLLDSEGIPAFVADEHTIAMQWLYSDAIGGVKVQVPEPFVVQAKELLNSDFSQSLVEEQGFDAPQCPNCKSHEVEFEIKGKKPAFIVFLITHFPLWPFKKVLRCRSCGMELKVS